MCQSASFLYPAVEQFDREGRKIMSCSVKKPAHHSRVLHFGHWIGQNQSKRACLTNCWLKFPFRCTAVYFEV